MSGMRPAAEAGSAMAVFRDERWEEFVPRHWCAGDAFETRLLEAMSLIAPEVERFVIGAVTSNVNLRGDGECARAASAFIREEAEHSRVHRRFNQRLASQGVDPAKVLACVRSAAELARRWLPPGAQLAIAAACEHLSALLSLSFLRAERRSEIRPASVARLFEQHAREEIGHRAIVFDLLKDAGGSGWIARAAALTLVSIAGLLCVPLVANALLRSDGSSGSTGRWGRRAARWVRAKPWISPRVLLGGWLAYLTPGFHPRHLPDA